MSEQKLSFCHVCKLWWPVSETVQYILCQACHSLEILEMVSLRSLVCEIASRICSAPLRPPLHQADLASLLYWSTGSKYKGFIEVYWNWYSSYCLLLAHDIGKYDFITWFKCVRCTVYPYSVYVGRSKVTSGAIVCLFGTAVPVSLSTWHFNLPLLKVQRNLVYEHSCYTILYTMQT